MNYYTFFLMLLYFVGNLSDTDYEYKKYENACEYLSIDTGIWKDISWVYNVPEVEFKNEFTNNRKFQFSVSNEIISIGKEKLCDRFKGSNCDYIKEYKHFNDANLELLPQIDGLGHLVFFTKPFNNYLFCVITSKKNQYPCYSLNYSGSRVEIVFSFNEEEEIEDYYVYKTIIDARSEVKPSPNCDI